MKEQFGGGGQLVAGARVGGCPFFCATVEQQFWRAAAAAAAGRSQARWAPVIVRV